MNWSLLNNSLLVAGSTTALALGFGLVVALWVATLPSRWRNLVLVLAAMALALPPFLVTNSWLDWLGDNGIFRAWLPFRIYSLAGAVWILMLILWPITLFAVLAAWRRLEAAQLECEPALTGLALVRHLLIPIARGELALAGVLTFVLALNNFAVPVILQTQVLPEEMWVRFTTQLDAVGALKVSVPLMIVPMLVLAWATRRAFAWPRVQGTVSPKTFRRQLSAPWRLGSGIVTLLLCGLAVVAPVAQILMAKRTWTELSGAVEAGTSAIWNSFYLAALAAISVMGLAILLNCRGNRPEEACASGSSIGKRLLTSSPTILVWLPFFIPGVLIGIAMIKLFNRPVLVSLYQSSGIVLLAFCIRYFAVGWTGARHALGSTDPDLADAARLEGATRWQMLRHVDWPQIAPQLSAAAYVVYLLCLWDVESMVLVVPPGGETLALRIFNLLHYGYAGQVNALCLALLVLALLPLALWGIWKLTFNIQHSTFNAQGVGARKVFGGLSLMALVSLVLGAWCFTSGCSPNAFHSGEGLHSRFFDHAEVLGTRGVGIGEFNKPRSVAVDTQDNVYAVDMTGRVQKFSPDGKYILSWQMPQTKLGKPKGMSRDHDGNIVVVEPHYQRVNHFTTDGKLVLQWGCRGTNEGCFLLPRGIAENSKGEFLVSEYQGAERVQRFEFEKTKPLAPALSPSDAEREKLLPLAVGSGAAVSNAVSGAPILRGIIGRAGTGPGEFNRPEGLCVDAQDRIYVADSCNHRIQIFSKDGKFIRQYGKAGSGLGELSYPYDITVDAQGNQYVCEFGNSRIQVFDANCQPVEIIGGPGVEPGRFANPWGLAFDSHGNLYVADALNHRVQKLVRRGATHAKSESAFSVQ